MKPVTQTITEIGKGNCFAACLASLLHLECDEVPNFIGDSAENDNWFATCNEWLAKRGYSLLMIRHQPDAFWLHGDVLCIASVASPRFEGSHAVIVELDYGDVRLVHDPHPSKAGFDGDPRFYYFLLPARTEVTA